METRDSIRPRGPIVIDIENITKDYVMGEETVRALRGVSLRFTATVHRGNGTERQRQSTLMTMLGCLDTPTSGRYEFNGKTWLR